VGHFYVNFNVKGATQPEIVDLLRTLRLDAYVGPEAGSWICFSERGADEQDQQIIAAIGAQLSARLDKPVLCVLNHDDDILALDLFATGVVIAEYNSCPGYFEESPDEERLKPSLSGVEQLAALGNKVTPAAVRQVLTTDDQDFASGIHESFVNLLGLPEYSVAFGYNYIAKGEFEHMGASIVRTGA
jgi:hypothetical protein